MIAVSFLWGTLFSILTDTGLTRKN